MSQDLRGKKIAILATDGFEQSELIEPKLALEKAGADVVVIAPKGKGIKAWNKTDWGRTITVDKILKEADASTFDALMLPGGVMNPDQLRKEQSAINFVKSFFKEGKPIAAICHGPQLLIETGLLDGRKLTSYPSIKTDLINAGADWVDEEVVVDNGLITSRTPADIPAFCKKMIEEFAEGKHYGHPGEEGVSATH
jgi:protease I